VAVVEVRWLELDRPDREVAALGEVLTSEELARIARLATNELRRRATVRLALRRRLLAEALGIEVSELDLRREPTGQPVVLSTSGRVFLSASSSGGLGLLAWSQACAVGIDLEHLEELGDEHTLLDRIATPTEQTVLRAVPADALRPALLALWVRKEAYLKATGEGIGAGLQRATLPLDAAPWGLRFDPGDGSTWRLYELEGPSDVGAALVAASGDEVPEVRVATG
jgi:4'-phosphopantetheinyl transferase